MMIDEFTTPCAARRVQSADQDLRDYLITTELLPNYYTLLIPLKEKGFTLLYCAVQVLYV